MTKERNDLMVAEWAAGASPAALCRENGIGQRQFYLILKKYPDAVRQKKSTVEEKQPLSRIHSRIGRELYDFYWGKNMDRQRAANRLGWGSLRLRSVEKGEHDLTLFELQDIASFMGMTVGALLDG